MMTEDGVKDIRQWPGNSHLLAGREGQEQYQRDRKG